MISRFLLCVALALGSVSAAAASNDEDTRFAVLRQQMRDLVIGIAQSARATRPDFLIITQNGLELLTEDGSGDGPLVDDYIAVIDGVSQEGTYAGFERYCDTTPRAQTGDTLAFLDQAYASGRAVLLTDYCDRDGVVSDIESRTLKQGFLSFVSTQGDFGLDQVPATPIRPATGDAATLRAAKNYLYLLNPEAFASADVLVDKIAASNFDIVILDAFFEAGQTLTPSQVSRLKRQPGGGRRQVVAYINVGAAENWRYYWQPAWDQARPEWIDRLYSDDYPDEYWVRYWRPEWHDIIYAGSQSYLSVVLAAGFDGVFLDNVDAYWTFLEQ